MEVYYDLKNEFQTLLIHLKKKNNIISLLRLFCACVIAACVYIAFQTDSTIYFFIAFLTVAVFFILLRVHNKLLFKRSLYTVLVGLNNDEIDFLKNKCIPFENGNEFQDFSHSYAHDLDIFGEKSLFHNLNRTTIFIGKSKLAKQLLVLLPNSEIRSNQNAIRELSEKIKWRQDFTAFGKLSLDSKEKYAALLKWSKTAGMPISKPIIILSWVSPIVFILAMCAYLITSEYIILSLSSYIFIFNLALLGKFFKRIKSEIKDTENLNKTISSYGMLLQKIENEKFVSEKLKALQNQLKLGNQNASDKLKELSEIFSKMDSIGNFVTTFLFNGIFLFHIHTLKQLLDWKKKHAEDLEKWLEIIGEIEVLNSLANFCYNNPEFTFPKLNEDYKISFTNLSHPLLSENTRIGNDINFDPQSFIILTGSNMSGKSTFLRSLGINMVLAGIGATVCANNANIHPLQVLVSMRLSDSLSDNTSYFYAEIKRLKQIMNNLEQQRSFVLLDEILRGTNSDDKRSGTIAVVEKMISYNAIGAIATHDIEVCNTTKKHPEKLVNQCFEAEIVNNDLFFDYKLRDGICKNKSATFLLEKMEII